MLVHCLLLDTWKGVIDEGNVTLSKCATVHTEGTWIRRPSVPTLSLLVPSFVAAGVTWITPAAGDATSDGAQ